MDSIIRGPGQCRFCGHHMVWHAPLLVWVCGQDWCINPRGLAYVQTSSTS